MPSALSRLPIIALLALVMAATGLMAGPVRAAEEPVWSQTSLQTVDGETLLVDVLHPADLLPADTDDQKRPVVLIVSPYLGDESGLDWSKRFKDFYDGAYAGEGIFANGWSAVQVHTRGTSGSTGCLDILGPGEQTDIISAVEWVNDQPWADGVVMYGKSYDANTGVAALANNPAGLDAVIAQAIGPDRYRATHNNRVRLAQSLLYPATYRLSGEANFSLGSEPDYIANSATHPVHCRPDEVNHFDENEFNPFWRIRDFPDRVDEAIVDIPTFITAGYLDNATNIGGGAVDIWNAVDSDEKFLWLGWWDHVRGNDVESDGSLAMGRDDWFAATTGFIEHNVKGTPKSVIDADPRMTYPDYKVAAQTSTGDWRAEDRFPAADTVMTPFALRSGTYTDDGQGRGNNGAAGAGGLVALGSAGAPGVWTFGDVLDEDVHIAGIPEARLFVSPLVPRSNVVVNIYDVDEDANATMVSRGAYMVDSQGEIDITMWPTDWVFAEGHRIAVRVMDANTENYVHVPSGGEVIVRGGQVDLPVLPADRPASPTAGVTNNSLEDYKQRAGFSVASQLAAAEAGAVADQMAGALGVGR